MKLNEKELKSYEKFRKKHYKKCSASEYKIRISYTGIGEKLEIKCCKCKKKEDISDYDSW